MRKITFLKTMLLAGIMLAGNLMLVAQITTLPHHDPINYTVGQALQTQGGWTTLNTGDDLLITSGNLSFPGLATSSGNKISFDGSGIDAAKLFTQQTSGTTYYSFLINVTSLGSLSTTGGYLTGFTEGTGTTFGATVWTRSDGTGYDIGINPRTTAANTVWSSGTTSLNSTLFIVISYEIVTGATNDVVKMWINPTPGASEPTATLTATNGLVDLANVNRILIRQDNTTNTPFVEMDELRIGTTWADVTTPASSTPTVATPTFNPAAGTYTSTQNVTIATTTADASIYYTINGDEPTETSTPYTVPVEISTSTTLKAKAYKAGMDPSATATAVYTINPTPTITVTEVTIPTMNSVVPNIDTEIINVSGTNLTGEITLTIAAIDGFDSSVFGVTPTLPSTGGVATISFYPGIPGIYAATLKINSAGAAEVTRTINGTATLSTPFATGATGVNSTGFTANWEIVEGASSYELNVYTKNQSVTTATDLFFSEYIEGSSNNKALEIYNGTGAPVDLSQYKVELYSNGSTSVGNSLTMTGILNNGDVYVIYNSSANAGIQAVGDVSSTVTYFNGDDAIVLKKGETIIDVIGRVGEDPGTDWTADGGYSTLDKTLIRKSNVTGGVTTNPSSGFPTLATEWDVFTIDYIDNLGTHTMAGAGNAIIPIAGSPFTINPDTYKTLSGLTPETQYFYTVIAKYGTYSSAVSNEITVSTTKDTGIDQPTSIMNVYAVNGKVHFTATAGEKVEIYNAVGQRVVNTLSTDGLNSFSIDAKGVLLVKVGERIGKVIM